jgi:hypothetical protein
MFSPVPMTDKAPHSGIDYIPASYRAIDIGNATMWMDQETVSVELGPMKEMVASSIDGARDLLDFTPARRIHVVLYANKDDSRVALGRTVHPTFLMAPLHTPTHAVIVMHSAKMDPRNGDPYRMHRHVCHEVSHVFAAERSGSVKRLGDGSTGMRIRPWVDEGFAECVASVVAARPDVVERARQGSSKAAMSWEEVDSVYNDLDSPHRLLAAAMATTAVWRAVQKHGFRFVFARLDDPAGWMVEE